MFFLVSCWKVHMIANAGFLSLRVVWEQPWVILDHLELFPGVWVRVLNVEASRRDGPCPHKTQVMLTCWDTVCLCKCAPLDIILISYLCKHTYINLPCWQSCYLKKDEVTEPHQHVGNLEQTEGTLKPPCASIICYWKAWLSYIFFIWGCLRG